MKHISMLLHQSNYSGKLITIVSFSSQIANLQVPRHLLLMRLLVGSFFPFGMIQGDACLKEKSVGHPSKHLIKTTHVELSAMIK